MRQKTKMPEINLINKIFAEIQIGRDFTYLGDVYQKVSYETAIPILFNGKEKTFKWDDIVELIYQNR